MLTGTLNDISCSLYFAILIGDNGNYVIEQVQGCPSNIDLDIWLL